MKKLVAILAAFSVILCFAACGKNSDDTKNGDAASTVEVAENNEKDVTTTAPTEEELKNLEISDFDYYIEHGYLKYVITIHNPNTDVAVEYPSFRITAKSADGTILGNEEQTLSVIYPGQDFVFASQAFSVENTPADVKVEMKDPDSYDIKKTAMLEHPEFVPLKVENTALIGDDFSDKITGEIKNDNDYVVESAHLCVVFRDANGKVTTVDSTYVDKIAANSSTPFELSIYSDNTTDSYEVYANIWG